MGKADPQSHPPVARGFVSIDGECILAAGDERREEAAETILDARVEVEETGVPRLGSPRGARPRRTVGQPIVERADHTLDESSVRGGDASLQQRGQHLSRGESAMT